MSVQVLNDSSPTAGAGPSTSRGRSQRVNGEGSGEGTSRLPPFVVGSYRGLGALPVKGQSFCTCPVVVQERSRYLKCNCGEDDVFPEWFWDPETASGASELSDDGQTVRFHVKLSCGTAAVRGAKPLHSGQYFWEIKMITPVYGTDMMVGVGTSMVELDSYKAQFCSLLGRDAESWGLSYMGRLHHRGQVLQHGSRFGQGSIIGIHLDMWHGTLRFYKNRRPMGISCSGLKGKVLYPMVCSTAAQSGMKLIKARSFHTSLQFMCCQALRRIIPRHLDVFDVLPFPPGLKEFLANNLSWLLQGTDLQTGASSRDKDEEEKCWSDGVEEDEEDDKSDTSSENTWTPATSPPSSEAPSWVGAFEGTQVWANTCAFSVATQADAAGNVPSERSAPSSDVQGADKPLGGNHTDTCEESVESDNKVSVTSEQHGAEASNTCHLPQNVPRCTNDKTKGQDSAHLHAEEQSEIHCSVLSTGTCSPGSQDPSADLGACLTVNSGSGDALTNPDTQYSVQQVRCYVDTSAIPNAARSTDISDSNRLDADADDHAKEAGSSIQPKEDVPEPNLKRRRIMEDA